MPSGYSGTPLSRKLGLKPGFRVFVDGAPANFLQLLEPLPENVAFVEKIENDLDMIHLRPQEGFGGETDTLRREDQAERRNLGVLAQEGGEGAD